MKALIGILSLSTLVLSFGAGAATIKIEEIRTATLGTRTSRDNATEHMRGACVGRYDSCDYYIHNRNVIGGDPAPGIGKAFYAEWRCTGDTAYRSQKWGQYGGENADGSTITLTCDPDYFKNHPPVAPSQRAIHIVQGTLGSPIGNLTDHLIKACDGETQPCDYYVHHDNCKNGDSEPGVAKSFFAEWTCGDDPAVHQSTWGKMGGNGDGDNIDGRGVTIQCP